VRARAIPAAAALAALVSAAAAPARAQQPPMAATATAAAPAAPPPSPTPPPALRLAVETEGAFGLYPGGFYNQLAGARLDLRASPHVSFGGYVGYANLKGKEGRAHDVLAYALVEYMAGRPDARVRVPLRFASGYLPRNGPVVRVAGGLAFALTPKVDLVTELLAPMFWVTRNQMVLSTNVSLELAFSL
jgi:hypothetical protein